MISKVINGIILLATGYLMYSCANPGTPSGGPKDTEPPTFVGSVPPMFSPNFKETKIKITFNEFILLKDLNNQLIVSPPVTNLPEIKVKGKSVIIEFKEELKQNTTYNIFFGSAIVDLRENNPLENFQFIFSTGNVIDSLSIEGKVFNAGDLKPLKSVSVMLYTNTNDTLPYDSLPYFVRPYYMTKTDEAGNFSLKNLANQSYKLFALNDFNGNLIYDQPSESIGFLVDTIHPTFKRPMIADSVELASGITREHVHFNDSAITYTIGVFQETDSAQRFLKTTVPKKNQLIFIFKRPTVNLFVNPLNIDIKENWAIPEYNPTRDTIFYWVNDVGNDSLKLEIIENANILDTIHIALFKKSKGKKSNAEDDPAKKLEIKNNLKSNSIDLNKPLILTFGYPIKSIDTSGIAFYENDSIPIRVSYSFVDTVHRKLKFDHKWKKSTSYSLLILDSTIIDNQNQKNDSIRIQFRSKSPEDYGNLFIDCEVEVMEVNYIVQLISDDKVVRETLLTKSERLSFTYLNPGKYRLKVIDDLNNNGIWDTGDYFYKVQPEKVRFFPAEIDVRPNWDIEEVWEF